MQTDTHFFFYKSALSQWHMVDFYVEGIKYSCGEQFMMSHKALLFNDLDAYKRIMNTYHPRDHQLIGRTIKNYDQQIWDTYKYEIVYNGNYARFKQNQDQLDLLLSTKGKLVEASPTDLVYGVGLSIHDPLIKDEKNWRGQNLLGKILTDVRDNLEIEFLEGLK